MNIVVRASRASGLAVAAALALQGLGGLALGPLAEAGTVATATVGLNVRSGPSTTYRILGVLPAGGTVTATGGSQNGWTPVTYAGQAAWVSTQYVRLAGSDPAPSTTATSGNGTSATTLETVNVRTGPGLNFAIAAVLGKGSKVTLTGKTSAGFSEISYGGVSRWVSSAWITTGGSSSSPASSLPAVTGQVRATTALMIRTTSGSDYINEGDVPGGTVLDVTGVTANGMAQIVYRGTVRWVNGAYLAPLSGGPAAGAGAALPSVTGTRYATAALNIRTSSGAGDTTVAEVPAGTALQVTGLVENGRAQIIYSNAVRWVTAQYLSATKPVISTGYSSGLAGLQPAAKAIVADAQARFTSVSTFYGVRPDTYPDHPSGHAVDMMLPSYASNVALGQQMADYYRANAKQFGIDYIIFNQHIWSTARSGEGWRFMADRGSDTANHKDHVHVTVF